MRHDWIYDVLNDLRLYAEKNSLPAIAAEAGQMLDIARAELSAQANQDQPADQTSEETKVSD